MIADVIADDLGLDRWIRSRHVPSQARLTWLTLEYPQVQQTPGKGSALQFSHWAAIA